MKSDNIYELITATSKALKKGVRNDKNRKYAECITYAQQNSAGINNTADICKLMKEIIRYYG